MHQIVRQRAFFFVLTVTAITSGCTELRGRRLIREGSRLYRSGDYAAARDAFEAATALVPQLPQAWMGEALACRQIMTPGAASPANDRAIECALGALAEVQRRWPRDSRGAALYIQTLFDADRFPALVTLFEERLKKDPSDLAALNGEIQAYSRSNHLEEALGAYQKKAALLPNDAEAQYAVGVFVWQQLFQRGGGPDKASFDPRVDPNAPGADATEGQGKGKRKRMSDHGTKSRAKGKGKRKTSDGAAPPSTSGGADEEPHKTPPPFAVGDITGAQRAALADLGIKYLQRALALRPQYREAMVYLNLLLRQKALAYLTRPSLWQATIDQAEVWRTRVEALTVAPAQAPSARAARPDAGPAAAADAQGSAGSSGKGGAASP
jgi:tetratricopeptide (TPR) repeat protein